MKRIHRSILFAAGVAAIAGAFLLPREAAPQFQPAVPIGRGEGGSSPSGSGASGANPWKNSAAHRVPVLTNLSLGQISASQRFDLFETVGAIGGPGLAPRYEAVIHLRSGANSTAGVCGTGCTLVAAELSYDAANDRYTLSEDDAPPRTFTAANGAYREAAPAAGPFLPATLTALAGGDRRIAEFGGRNYRIFDAGGREKSRGNPLGALTFTRDASGRISAITDAKNDVLTLSYSAGRLTSASSAGKTVNLDYEYGGNNLVAIRGPQFSQYQASGLSFSWNGASLISVAEAGKRGTTIHYDASGNVDRADDALGRQVRFVATSTRVVMTDSTGLWTAIEANSQGNVTLVESSDGGRARRSYDASGKLTEVRQAYEGGEELTNFAYDAQGRLTSIAGPKGSSSYVYAPGSGASDYPAQLTETDPFNNTVIVSFDARGRPLSASTYGRTASWTYDSAGDLTSHTDYFGNTVSIARNANGLPSSVTSAGQTRTLAYNAFGQVTSQTDAFGRTTLQTYDTKGRFESQSGANVPPISVARTPLPEDGERVSMTFAGRSSIYDWDRHARLAHAETPLGSVTTEFDPINGRPASVERSLRGQDWISTMSWSNTGELATYQSNGYWQQSGARVVPPGTAPEPSVETRW